MNNKIFKISTIALFIIIFIVFYKALQDTNIYTPKKKSNNEIPLFSANLFYSNKQINSSELFKLDKFYLLNIWSSWCVPCRTEHPLLMDLTKNKKIQSLRYVVSSGERYDQIIRGFGVSKDKLIKDNKLKNKKYLTAGDNLIINQN